VNVHLPDHARNYGTLVNTAVGIKEMVHRVFKGMVPHMNRKNVELDMTRRYNTQQALRHLVDGGTDPRFSEEQMVSAHLCRNLALRAVMKGWHATGLEDLAGDNDDDVEDDDGKETKNVYADVHFQIPFIPCVQS
jgi:hypothetical protein